MIEWSQQQYDHSSFIAEVSAHRMRYGDPLQGSRASNVEQHLALNASKYKYC